MKFLPFLLLAGLAAADDAWETLPDGSQGQKTEFRGAGDLGILAYVRKPAGPGPFPVVILGHGGRPSPQATLGLGRSQQSPTEDFIKAGWAVYSIDYRPSEQIAIVPLDYDDAVEAVK